MIEVKKYTDEASWLAGRHNDVTSTEVPALFGVSPWRSALSVWQAKHGEAPTGDAASSEAADIGKALEHAIASYAQGKLGKTLVRYQDYHRIPEHRVGASFDYIDGDGNIVEIKNVGPSSAKSWGDDIMPPHVELQVQTQLMCMPSADHATVFVLFCGNRTGSYVRRRDNSVQVAIIQAVTLFWRQAWPPLPGPADRDAIRRLCLMLRPRCHQLDGDEAKLLKQYRKAEALASELPLLRDRLRMLGLKYNATRLAAGKISVDVGVL